MSAAVVVEVEVGSQPAARLGEVLVSLQVDLLVGCPLLWYQQKGQCLCLMAS